MIRETITVWIKAILVWTVIIGAIAFGIANAPEETGPSDFAPWQGR